MLVQVRSKKSEAVTLKVVTVVLIVSLLIPIQLNFLANEKKRRVVNHFHLNIRSLVSMKLEYAFELVKKGI
jgi:hypothetical protein